MSHIDTYSYQLGAADCFCEMVAAGVKKIALSHPCDTKEQRDSFLEDFEKLCQEYHVHMYVEDVPFLTDLFPVSMNKGRYIVIFYVDEADLDAYLQLKQEKNDLIAAGTYEGAARRDLAVRYGKLLSYSDEGIQRLLERNKEKE